MWPAGHARVYVAFDVLYRLLNQLSYDVQYVRNFTDIDDKIIKRAAEAGEDPLALSARFITEFDKDMAALCCLPPTVSAQPQDCKGWLVAYNSSHRQISALSFSQAPEAAADSDSSSVATVRLLLTGKHTPNHA